MKYRINKKGFCFSNRDPAGSEFIIQIKIRYTTKFYKETCLYPYTLGEEKSQETKNPFSGKDLGYFKTLKYLRGKNDSKENQEQHRQQRIHQTEINLKIREISILI